MRNVLILSFALLIISCKNEVSEEPGTSDIEWNYQKTISLKGISPIGLAANGDLLYVSDIDHNKVIMLDNTGAIIDSITGFERPMHIDFAEYKGVKTLFVPEYGRDSVAQISKSDRGYLSLNDSLDAPAGISVSKDLIAIADFYNNRIVLKNNGNTLSFGKKGDETGAFNYPTDVQIKGDRIYVADAYNNRGQIFDLDGTFIAQFAQEDNLNAATGIFKSDDEIILTDFENNRIMVYGNDLTQKQVLKDHVDQPTDILVIDNTILYIANYRKGELIKYTKG